MPPVRPPGRHRRRAVRVARPRRVRVGARPLDPRARARPRVAPAWATASAGYVADLTTGRELYADEPDRALIPASNEKLYTTAAALLRFGPSATLTTTVQTRAGHADRRRRRGARRPLPRRRRRPEPRRQRPARAWPPSSPARASRGSRARSRATSRSSTRCAAAPTRGFLPDYDLGGWLGGLTWAHGRAGPGGPAQGRRRAPAGAAAGARASGRAAARSRAAWPRPSADGGHACWPASRSPTDGAPDRRHEPAVGQLLRRDAAQGARRPLRRRPAARRRASRSPARALARHRRVARAWPTARACRAPTAPPRARS